MITARVLCCGLLLFLPGAFFGERCTSAQQQTGAPAGIPVPPAPPVAPPAKPSGGPAAYTFRVRVLDGRTGEPIHNAHVRLWYDEPSGPGYGTATDNRGLASMPAPDGDPLRVIVSVADLVDCRRPMRGDPPEGYNLQAIATSGLSAANGCGRVAVHTQPGELVLFVRSPRWYEGINRGLTH